MSSNAETFLTILALAYGASKIGGTKPPIVCPDGYHEENGVCVVNDPGPDAIPPGVSIHSPVNGASIVAGTFNVFGTASDNILVQSVKVGIFTTSGSTAIPYKAASGTTNWSASFTLSTPGPFVIKSEATDSAGNKATFETTITITSGPITCPAGQHLENGVCVPDEPTTGQLDEYGILKIYGDSSPAIFLKNPGYSRTQNNTRDQFFFPYPDSGPQASFLPMESTSYQNIDFTADDETGYKVWGGKHTGSGDNNTTRQGRCYGCGINKNGTPHIMKEFPYHPQGSYSLETSKLKYINPSFPKNGSMPTLGDIQHRMIGHKYVIYLKDGKAYMEYYVDTAPFVNGKPQNQWQLMYTCVDDGTWGDVVYTTNQGILFGGIAYWVIRIDDVGAKTGTYGISCRKIDPNTKLKTFTGQW